MIHPNKINLRKFTIAFNYKDYVSCYTKGVLFPSPISAKLSAFFFFASRQQHETLRETSAHSAVKNTLSNPAKAYSSLPAA